MPIDPLHWLNEFAEPISCDTVCPFGGSYHMVHCNITMWAQTDDCRHRQMGSEKFGGLQHLRSGYHDGRLEAVNEAWMQIDHVFAIDE